MMHLLSNHRILWWGVTINLKHQNSSKFQLLKLSYLSWSVFNGGKDFGAQFLWEKILDLSKSLEFQ